jgi:NitT/TauT family transport system permease protein
LKPALRAWPIEKWLPGVILVLVLSLWEIAVQSKWISALLFPAPSFIGARLAQLIASGELIGHVQVTLLRAVIGFVLGCVSGISLGWLMGWSRRIRALIDPFVAAIQPMPKIALLPLILVIFGIGESSKIILIAVSAFFPVLINTLAGVRQISPIHFEVAQSYGASRLKLFTRVIAPGSLAMMLAGLQLAMNTALVVTIAVELLSANKGLGALIWLAWETLRTEDLYAALLVIGLIGLSINFLIHKLNKRLAPWQVEREI